MDEMPTENANSRKFRKDLHREPLTVVKVGGAVIEDSQRLQSLLDDFASISGRKILVHGGGRKDMELPALMVYPHKLFRYING